MMALVITNWLTPTTLFFIINLMIFTIFIFTQKTVPQRQNQNHHQHITRTGYSFLERVRSIKFSTYVQEPENPERVFERKPSLLERVKSIVQRKEADPKPEPQQEREPEPEPEPEPKTGLVEDKEVDAKADDFIKRFKEQLMMQRLESLLRHRELTLKGKEKL